ncbi:MAG: carbohydrate ABC transporter permease [Cohnella sp.]|nr:carbohydrate ABC transporter permease [Cohnella sp.]
MKSGIDYKQYLFNGLNYALFIVFGLATLVPFLHILAESLSSQVAVVSGKVSLLPVGLQWDTFKLAVINNRFLNSFKISLVLTGLGTLISVLLTVLAAYPLSKPHLKGRKLFLLLYIFVMVFHGGMIPDYLLVKELGLMNTIWSLILPGIIWTFNLLIVKNYFEELPEGIEEAAKIDGASYNRMLFQIVLPLSTPVIATVALFYAVGYWESYFNAMLYISSPGLKPLQLYLYEMITQAQKTLEEMTNVEESMNISTDSMRSASVIAVTIPMLIVYPYLQKYFVKGIIVGSVKG